MHIHACGVRQVFLICMYINVCRYVRREREYEYQRSFHGEDDLKGVRPIPWQILYLQYFTRLLLYTQRDFSNQHHLTLKNITLDILRRILDLIQNTVVQLHPVFFFPKYTSQFLFETLMLN